MTDPAFIPLSPYFASRQIIADLAIIPRIANLALLSDRARAVTRIVTCPHA